jgi:hypothetical protein
MTHSHPHFYDKIINSHLACTALRGIAPYGEFKAIVRLARPEKHPSYMTVTGIHSPGHVKARIRCDQIARIGCDRNVLSVELRQHVMQ